MSLVLSALFLLFIGIAIFSYQKTPSNYTPLSDGPLGHLESGNLGFQPEDERGRILGIGKFGRVETFRHPNQGLYAAKYISLDQPANKRRLIEELAMKEITILERLHHKNTIRLFEKVISDESIIIYTALYDGNLSSVYKDRNNNWFTQEEICHTARQILKALKYIHSIHIVHRDIKSDNILVDVSGIGSQIKRVYLADFGIAEIMENSQKLETEKAGTHPYMAPELYKDPPDTYDPYLADIYSFGVLLWELSVGKLPREWEPKKLKKKNPFQPLVKSCVRSRPSTRASLVAISEILMELSGKKVMSS